MRKNFDNPQHSIVNLLKPHNWKKFFNSKKANNLFIKQNKFILKKIRKKNCVNCYINSCIIKTYLHNNKLN
jgi:hypothetical protein